MNKMKRYYCTEHSLDRRNPLKENRGLCQAAGLDGHCNMVAQFEVEMISHTPTSMRNYEKPIVGTWTNIPLDYNKELIRGDK